MYIDQQHCYERTLLRQEWMVPRFERLVSAMIASLFASDVLAVRTATIAYRTANPSDFSAWLIFLEKQGLVWTPAI